MLFIGALPLLAPTRNPAEHGSENGVCSYRETGHTNQDCGHIPTLPNQVDAEGRDGATSAATAKHEQEGGPTWTDIVIALASVVTACFGIALWRSTDKLWTETKALAGHADTQATDFKESLKHAKISADAAKVSAEAAVAAQRPWIRVEVLSVGEMSRTDRGIRLDLTVDLRNTGNSPANSVTAWAALAVGGGQVFFEDAISSTPIMPPNVGFSLFPKDGGPFPMMAAIADADPRMETALSSGMASNHVNFGIVLTVRYAFVGGAGMTRKLYLLRGPNVMEMFDVRKLPIETGKITAIPLPMQDIAE